MCYNEEQNEYLINSGNISRVVNVTVNGDNTAHITAMMIPKFIYDDYYAILRDAKTKENYTYWTFYKSSFSINKKRVN